MGSDWVDIEKIYYNELAEDYAVKKEDSFVYGYYVRKGAESSKIDKKFKDFLYTAGFRMIACDDDAPSAEGGAVYVQRLEERTVRSSNKQDRTIKGRAVAKTDPTLRYISEICKRNWVLSFDGVSHLDDVSFKETAVRLFEHICREYHGKKLRMDIILACDPRTGVSLHLMGIDYLMDRFMNRDRFFKGISSPCAFAVSGRVVSDDSLYYEFCDDTDHNDDNEEELYVYGLTKDFTASDMYRIAVVGFKEVIEASLDQFTDAGSDDDPEAVQTKNVVDDLKTDPDLQDFVKTALQFEED